MAHADEIGFERMHVYGQAAQRCPRRLPAQRQHAADHGAVELARGIGFVRDLPEFELVAQAIGHAPAITSIGPAVAAKETRVAFEAAGGRRSSGTGARRPR
ncbi:hypothetical protein AD428_14490 [Achromobacter sp. DMS1]|nr:hypothetical protein AD428_14490 [Achromobacter sp. DMS1]